MRKNLNSHALPLALRLTGLQPPGFRRSPLQHPGIRRSVLPHRRRASRAVRNRKKTLLVATHLCALFRRKKLAMPPASAPFITKRVVAEVVDNEVVDTRQPPWQPILANASLALKPPPPPTEEELAA